MKERVPMDMQALDPAEVLELYGPHEDTIPSLLASRSSAIPSQPVLRFESRRWTYSQLEEATSKFASLLWARGVRAGDRFAHVAPNSDLTVLLYVALAKIGAVFVPMNIELTNDDLSYLIQHSAAVGVFSRNQDCGRLQSIARDLPARPWSLEFEGLVSEHDSSHDILKRLEASTGGLPQPSTVVLANDPAVVIYTSGTTGLPKGVLHSHRNYVLSAEAFVERMHLQPTDRLLSIFPFFHANALFYSLGGALAAGGEMITTARFSASNFWNVAAEFGATQFNILAAVGAILGRRPRSEFNPHHTIRKIYGGPISAETYQVFQQEFNVPLLIEGYGMSEIPAAASNPFRGPHKIGSIGKPCVHPRFKGRPFTELRIEDDNGGILPPGRVGEITVRTPVMFKGYLNDPQQTAAALRNGWLLTGDLGYLDEDGYAYFVARKKDIIRRRGENISGAELDRLLSSHPAIAEAATIGVPSELGEEEIMVLLVAQAPARPSEREIAIWCRERLAPMKVPRYVLYVDELPHTPTQRIAKHVLKQDAGLRERAVDTQASFDPTGRVP
jgi:carnitine-CoA ligase